MAVFSLFEIITQNLLFYYVRLALIELSKQAKQASYTSAYAFIGITSRQSLLDPRE
jgi:hypothetical protein